jgi:hypothetical protein
MITQILPSAVGNALKIYLEQEPTALAWVILRNTTGIFPSYNDVNSVSIYEGDDETYLMDTCGLVNGTLYYYCEFYWDGTAWNATAIVSGKPNYTYTDQSVDVLTIVRDRLQYGLENEIIIGTLSPASGQIQVLNAPPIFDETNFPVVTVHVAVDGSGDRAIGEMPFTDEFDAVNNVWKESSGWMAHVSLTIIGWSKNPDERIALRRALRKIVIGNLEVFDNYGIILPEFSQQDVDALPPEYPAAVYESVCTFTCEAPSGVADTQPVYVADPIVNATPVFL